MYDMNNLYDYIAQGLLTGDKTQISALYDLLYKLTYMVIASDVALHHR